MKCVTKRLKIWLAWITMIILILASTISACVGAKTIIETFITGTFDIKLYIACAIVIALCMPWVEVIYKEIVSRET